MAALLPSGQKPALLAVASRAWPGTGQAFQSGASRILYRPLEAEQLKDALKAEKKNKTANRRKIRALRSEDRSPSGSRKRDAGRGQYRYRRARPRGAGYRARADETRTWHFRCVLPGTDFTLQGHADVMWASDQGRAGLFFSKLSPAGAQATEALARQAQRSQQRQSKKHGVHDLMPPEDAHVSFPSPNRFANRPWRAGDAQACAPLDRSRQAAQAVRVSREKTRQPRSERKKLLTAFIAPAPPALDIISEIEETSLSTSIQTARFQRTLHGRRTPARAGVFAEDRRLG